jgi:hypothetical protein
MGLRKNRSSDRDSSATVGIMVGDVERIRTTKYPLNGPHRSAGAGARRAGPDATEGVP